MTSIATDDDLISVTREQALLGGEGPVSHVSVQVTLVQLLGPTGPKASGEPPLACYAARTCAQR